MLRLKLQRTGRKNRASFRLVVTNKRTGPKSNKHVAIVGFYDPINKEKRFKKEEIKEWLKKGVQPTDTVHNLLVSEGIIEGKKKNVLPKKSPIIDEEALKKAEEEKIQKEAENKEVENKKETDENPKDEKVTKEQKEDKKED